MEDRLINFETAQLAKEKGFKEKTFYYYYYYEDNEDNRELCPEKIGTSELIANSVSGMSSKTAADAGFGGCHTGDYLHYRVVLKELLIDVNKYPAKNVMFQAPTIAEVVMWLYEKYGIWVRITPIPYSDNLTHWRWEHMSTNYATRNAGWKKQEDYMSPTEAYQAAILYALKHLI